MSAGAAEGRWWSQMDDDRAVEHFARAKNISAAAAKQRLYVQSRASVLHDAVRPLLGDRFAEIRIDDDGFVRVTVIDMSPDDIDAIDRIAADAGISEWVRTSRADPAALHAWDEVRQELIHIGEADSHALQGHPSPDPGYRRPPFDISLSAYAIDIAAMLHERFGTWVSLRLGAFAYPLDPDQRPRRRDRESHPTIDPTEMRVELAGPLDVQSGHTTTHPFKVTNLGHAEIVLMTNGQLTAEVVDPQSGRTIGGYVGGQITPLIPFPIPSHAVIRVPLLVGTASFDPELGYAVPAGSWSLRTMLKLSDGRTLYTYPLPFTIAE